MEHREAPVKQKQLKSVTISEVDNGYVVSCYDYTKEMKTVHESMDSAVKSMMKMMGKEMPKTPKMSKSQEMMVKYKMGKMDKKEM